MSVVSSEVDVHVGQRMRQRREALGISQGNLGRHLGLTFSQIQKYEKGSNRVGAGRLYQIARFLGVEPSWFYEGVGGAGGEAGRNPAGNVSAVKEDMRVLVDAFAAIEDQETRASVLALVRSLVAFGRHGHDAKSGRHT